MGDQHDRSVVLERISEVAARCGWTVGCAESLTSGAIASALGRAPRSSDWFRGGVVAYASEVKHSLLQVPGGVHVVSRPSAVTMAASAARRLGADVCVAVTGIGGPDPVDGMEPGTVWFAVVWPQGRHAEQELLDGDPGEVVERTTDRALDILADALGRAGR